ncbi:MAG: proline dehydrogenase family protein [Dehalococcoidia bacterium]|nr:proline dehydrogenase family protein [Dehalococcoidia bacterium]
MANTPPARPGSDGAFDLEAAIQRRGRDLLAGVKPERLIALTPAWWQERLMGWATADPDFRVKLLRFVDVLPALRSSSAVADHVRQYFRGDTPLPVRMGSAAASAGAFRPVLSKVVRQGVFAMSDRFIGGSGPAEALPRLKELVESGATFTIDLLGEATLSEPEADAYRARYEELIAALAEAAPGWHAPDAVRRPNISVKLSALTSHFEPAAPATTSRAVRERLVPLLRAARQAGAFVNVDMEQHRYRELTHVIFEDIVLSDEFKDWDGIGIVVQAYLRDSPGDIARLRNLAQLRGTPITVRLVKGAYWDEEVIVAGQEGHPVPVFEDKDATDGCYEACTSLLVDAYPHLRPAFGTHNPRTIAQALAKVERSNIINEHVEFQVLYGMAEGLRKSVQALGYRTRVYVPAGEILPGMAYLVRRLLENTSNQSWLLHRHEEGDPAELLRPPRIRPLREDAPPAAAFVNVPTAELHKPGPAKELRDAIATARREAGAQFPLVIGGAEIAGREWHPVTSPADPSFVLGHAARATREDADAAVAAAREALPGWRATPAADRAAILREAASRMEQRRYAFAATMVLESAKPWREADGDVAEAIDYLRYYAAEAERMVAGVPLVQVPGELNTYRYEPRGVAAVIAPWNFPLAIITGMASAAIAAGCPAILKPAEQSPLIAAKLVQLLREAGLPPGVVQYLPGSGEEVGRALVEHAGVDVIAFTGSNAVGLSIIQSAAVVRPGQRNIKRVICEMGGKNAVIVDEDADLDQAVAGVVASAFGYAGQKCSAASRAVVVGSAYGEFRARLAAAVESLVVGPPEDAYSFVPPVISAEAKSRIEEYIAIGRADGQLVARRDVPELPGHYVAPHVFERLPRGSRLAREEVFGPVLALFEARTFDEALEVALDSDFALTGGLYSRHPGHIARAIDAFRVGNLYINRKITGAVVGRQPFGGMAMSGAGDKAGGPEYLLQFVTPRVVTENTVRRGFAPERGA